MLLSELQYSLLLHLLTIFQKDFPTKSLMFRVNYLIDFVNKRMALNVKFMNCSVIL